MAFDLFGLGRLQTLPASAPITAARLGGLDVFRHTLAFCVIIIHTKSGSYSAETLSLLDRVIEIVDGAVMGFFLMSGFFFPAGRFAGPNTGFQRFFGARARRILVPFFLFSLLYALALAMLGKAPLADGLWRTLVLHGASMQLYFLPLLFAAEILLALWLMMVGRVGHAPALHGVAVLLLVGASLCWQTPYSTGSDPRLYAVYLLSFIIGMILKAAEVRLDVAVLIVAVELLLSFVDARFLDLALVTLLFLVFHRASAWLSLDRSLPGSGGIYLLHTTIVNFAVSSILLALGIGQVANLVATVLITWAGCLAVTLLVVRYLPRWKFLLLE